MILTAGLLREAALENDPDIVSRVARRWAGRDTEATIEWLETLSDDAARTAGLAGVGRVWTGQDPAAAEAWVLGLPRREARDVILYWMIYSSVITRGLSAKLSAVLFDAHSSDQARQIAAANIARELADREHEVERMTCLTAM